MTSRSTYDYIIVGAGSAGCVLAAKLAADASARVLLLEAGGDHRKRSDVQRPAEYLRLQGTSLDWNYSTTVSAGLAGRTMICPRGRMLGGSSGINAMIYHEGLPEDLDAWQNVAGDFWNREAIELAMQELRGELESTESIEFPAEITPTGQAFMAAAKSACDQGKIAGRPEIYRRTTRRGARQSAMQAFLDSPPANLTIRSDTMVQRLEIRNGRTAGVVVGKSNHIETLDANRGVILAAGAIASPQLLMLSGIGPTKHLAEHGITTQIDSPAVGAGLVDHLAFPVTFAAKSTARFPSRWSMRDLVRWSYDQRGPIGSNLAEVGGFFDLPSRSGVPDAVRERAIQLHVTPTHYLRYPADDSPAAITLAVTGSQPISRGRVSLRSAEIDDSPSIDPGYLSDSRDVEVLAQGVELAREIAASEPLADWIDHELLPGEKRRTAAQLERAIRRFALTLYHPVGSCSMGIDPAASVVDPQLRVHGVENLYIADASVFPTLPRANPQATVMMVASRAAGAIANHSAS
ncbi:Alcohol dehydrogenase [acceptor] [Rosistilla ulvae]|uniref:Alcohol dehydrogenase [acceptor] n=1 Tax=Rosistilla ulvae TaxID=1930277 RepID=A0A517M6S3_9BACT|nr:GMC oxidoreductase [Rosistilla ulvae]QDS90556.1 Alcohol dehydrogenase [acceptor] [Rosistilla ulvae]